MMAMKLPYLAVSQLGGNAKVPDTRMIEIDIHPEMTLHAHHFNRCCFLALWGANLNSYGPDLEGFSGLGIV